MRFARGAAIGVASLVLALVACAAPNPTPAERLAARAESSRDGLILRAVTASATVAEGDVIEVTATLANTGRGPQNLTGPGRGLIGFGVTRLEDGLTSGPPGSRLDCGSYVLSPDEPMTVPFAKSGGFGPDDPNADFMEAYLADPGLTLPPGTWRIDVRMLGSVGHECGDAPIDLAVDLVVFVTPAR